MKTLVFTICAANYIGLAKVLGRSVRQHGPDVTFRIYVVEAANGMADDDLIVAAPQALSDIIAPIEYANMAFMYNVTEFCTALKAACFKHAFAQNFDQCIYMDPDILVMASLDHITGPLEESAILVTPHLCLPALGDGPRADRGILATGVYNLGFLGLRDCADVRNFLDWWHERLRRQAFNDHYNALFTDQRWMDFVPSLFPAEVVRIWRHLGCNVAPWNYHERRIEHAEGGFTVRSRSRTIGQSDAVDPLVFLHFSGFDFRRILDGRFDQLNLANADTYADLALVYDHYGQAIRDRATEMARYLTMSYAFDRFADGSPILPSHRRLFRVWRERHGDASDPFAVGPATFHAALKAQHLLAGSSGRDLAADKATLRDVAASDALLGRARTAFRMVFRMLGRARFFFLVRGLNRLSHVEQHYDTFQLDRATIAGAATASASASARSDA